MVSTRKKRSLGAGVLMVLAITGFAARTSALDAVVSFNELMYHPRDGNVEWIELHNLMTVDVDLSQWTISGGVDYQFPARTIIPGGGYLVIEGIDGGHGEALGPFSGRLSNNGEPVRLRNTSGRVMDEIDYGDSGRWPVAADGSGASLAKRSPRLASGLPESWTFSPQSGGTPGVENSFMTESARLQINEVASAGAPVFRVELVNAGNTPLETGSYQLENPDRVGGGISPLAAGTLPPGALLVLEEADLEFTVRDEGRLFLHSTTTDEIIDAVRVKNRTLARQVESRSGDRFFTPVTPTFGEPNRFAFRDEIVINEIMYHHRAQPARTPAPENLERRELAPFDGPWRFNQTGADLGPDWAEVAHATGGPWQRGPGILAFEFGSLPEPIMTTLDDPLANNPFVVTHYFETEVTLSAEEFARLHDMELLHIIDDGAVIYVNGVEVARPCMPEGPVNSGTLANCLVRNARLSAPILVPRELFVPGENRISVELHQFDIGSSDVVFGLSATARLTPEGSPSQPYADIDDEWIELHNRGDEIVDLDGWSLDGAIGFRFPEATTMSPGEFLVVARDAVSMAAKHPGIRIAGEFSGRLNNSHAYVKLEDAFQNPVDEVHYYDGGRWPGAADGNGSSLELLDPDADNAVAEAWASSDESSRASWTSFTYRAQAQPFPGTNDPTLYPEFLFGLLDAGEFLIDDISVIEDPDGDARELIQNGGFERDRVGRAPNAWRLVGTHGVHGRSVVANDPDGAGKVLHVVATGPAWHQQNQAETTLKFEGQLTAINSSREYEISFRARWLTGNPLLNTRLYFDRVARTHVLQQPPASGTPGAANSRAIENLGPTADRFSHSPLRPAGGESVRVQALVADPDGVASVTLHWSTNGTSYSQAAMTDAGGGLHRGEIPGHASNSRVQFYLTMEDALGATTTFPASGPASRALYRVGSEANGTHPAQHLEIIMLPSDEALLGTNTNLMSNHRWGGTVIYEDEVFYDVGIRLKGSQRGRPDLNRRGFNIAFNSEQRFRGVLKSIGLDRSGGWRFGRTFGQDEILIWHFMNRAGGIPAQHNDLVFLDAPGVSDGSAQLQLTRFGNEFLSSQFARGEEGSIHNYELIYFPTTTDGGIEGLKRPNPDSVVGVPIRTLGANKEAYRYYFQLRNNQLKDDFRGIMALTELFSRNTTDMLAEAHAVIDVDQWLRAFAAVSLAAVSDSYFNNSNAHNARLYHRPADGRMLLFPWDMDFAFINGTTSSLTPNADLNRLLQDPVNRRLYWGHVLDLVNTAYNPSYMNRWVEHYGSFLTGQNITPLTGFIQQRSSFARTQARNAVPGVSFAITTNDGNDFASPTNPVILEGTGWINIRTLRLAGSNTPLAVTWLNADSWRIEVPLEADANDLSIEAIGFDGRVIAVDTIEVTNTGPVVAATAENLVLTELMYHPSAPSAAERAAGFLDGELFEFIELQNITSETVDLGGAFFDAGIEFTVPPGTLVAPGQRVLIVKSLEAFHFRYPRGFPDAILLSYGSSRTRLQNSGERLSMRNSGGVAIINFTFADEAPWPTAADGTGYSLIPISPAGSEFDPARPDHWRSSSSPGGNPGGSDAFSFAEWRAGHENVAPLDDPENDGLVALVEYSTGGSPSVRERPLGLHFDPARRQRVSTRISIGADDIRLTAETSADLISWKTIGVEYAGSTNHGDRTRTVHFDLPGPSLRQFVRTRMTLLP